MPNSLALTVAKAPVARTEASPIRFNVPARVVLAPRRMAPCQPPVVLVSASFQPPPMTYQLRVRVPVLSPIMNWPPLLP